MDRIGLMVPIMVLVILLALSPITALAATKTYTGNGWEVTLSTDSDNYTIGQTVVATITFSGEFNGTIVFIVLNATSDTVYGDAVNLEQARQVNFSFTILESYGVGTYVLKASVKGSMKTSNGIQSINIPANEFNVTIQVQQPVQENTIILRGEVVDENNKPVANALVYVPGTDIRAVTDNNGEFVLYFHATGTYTLRLEKNDYYPEEYIIRVNETNTYVTLKLTTLAYQITLLKQKLGEITASLEKLNSTVAGQGERIAELEQAIASLNTTLSGKIEALLSQLQALENTIADLAGRVDGLEQALDNYATKDYVASVAANLTTSINALNTTLATVSARIDQLYEELVGRLNELADRLDSLNDAVKQLGDELSNTKSAQEALAEKVSGNENSIAKLGAQLSALAGKLDNTTVMLKKHIDNASLYGIIGIITGVVGIVLAAFAIMQLYRRVS